MLNIELTNYKKKNMFANYYNYYNFIKIKFLLMQTITTSIFFIF